MSTVIAPSESGILPRVEAPQANRALSASADFLRTNYARANLLAMRLMTSQSALRYTIFWGVNAFLMAKGMSPIEPFTRTLGTQYKIDEEGRMWPPRVQPEATVHDLAKRGVRTGAHGLRVTARSLVRAGAFVSQLPKGKIT